MESFIKHSLIVILFLFPWIGSAQTLVVESIDDSDPLINYSGDWVHSTTGCKCSWGNAAGISIDYSFTGNGIEIITERLEDRPIITMTLDDSISVDIDLYSSNNSGKFIIDTFKKISPGNHTLKIEVTGKNYFSGALAFSFFGFNVFRDYLPKIDTVMYRHTINLDSIMYFIDDKTDGTKSRFIYKFEKEWPYE